MRVYGRGCTGRRTVQDESGPTSRTWRETGPCPDHLAGGVRTVDESTGWLLDYDVEQRRDGWWTARRLLPISRTQIDVGVRRTILAPTYEDLRAECRAQTVAARWTARRRPSH